MLRSHTVLMLTALLGLGVGGQRLLAHHSFAAEFAADQPLKIKGAVNRVDWVNPHSFLYVDVADAAGKVTTWKCETAPPNGLFRRGWTKSTIKKGEVVEVEGFRAKDGSNLMNARSVLMANGKRMFAGSSGDGAPVREGDNAK
jgi:hypothetical protein